MKNERKEGGKKERVNIKSINKEELRKGDRVLPA